MLPFVNDGPCGGLEDVANVNVQGITQVDVSEEWVPPGALGDQAIHDDD